MHTLYDQKAEIISRRIEKMKRGVSPDPKVVPVNIFYVKTEAGEREISQCAWKTNCCLIFCSLPNGCEAWRYSETARLTEGADQRNY